MKKKSKEGHLILPNSPNIAVQSNRFIEARYKESLSFLESFLITKMCSMIAPEDMDFKPYKIYLHEVIDFMDLTPGGHVYNYIMEAAKRLLDRRISVNLVDENGRLEVIETHIVTSVRRRLEPTQDENLYVTLTFLPELKPFLLQLHRDFTKLDMEIFKRLKTASSIRLYQLFKSYIGKQQYKIQYDLEDLKEMLGVAEKYAQYAGFKMRVLDEAQKRLSEQTDVYFEYEEVKTGKKVSAIIFNISPDNKAKETEKLLLDTAADTSEAKREELVLELTPIVVRKFGVSLKVFMDLVEKHTEGEIRKAIEITEKGLKIGKISNAAGFFVEALRDKYTDAQTQKKETDKIQKAKIVETQQQEKVLNQEKQSKKQQEFEREKAAMFKLIAEKPALIPTLIERVSYSMFGSYYKKEKSFEENLEQPLILAAVLNIVKELNA